MHMLWPWTQTPKLMGFQDSLWNIRMSSLVIIVASIFKISSGKTDEQQCKPYPCDCCWSGQQMIDSHRKTQHNIIPWWPGSPTDCAQGDQAVSGHAADWSSIHRTWETSPSTWRSSRRSSEHLTTSWTCCGGWNTPSPGRCGTRNGSCAGPDTSISHHFHLNSRFLHESG